MKAYLKNTEFELRIRMTKKQSVALNHEEKVKNKNNRVYLHSSQINPESDHPGCGRGPNSDDSKLIVHNKYIKLKRTYIKIR